MVSLDEVLNGTPSDESTHAAVAEVVNEVPTGETPEAPAAESESEAATGESDDGAPPAPETDKNVPLKALEAERAQRQDWKEKAIRFEEELKHLREQNSQPRAQPQQQEPLTPDMALLNERFNMSEMMLRDKHDDVDEKLAIFQAEVAKNPSLGAELTKQKHPYDWMYKQATKFAALNEIGEDPNAYRERLRAEFLAEIEAAKQPDTSAEPAQASAAPLNLPKSLATARSSGGRSAPAWTGPTPLDQIVKR